MIFINIIFLIFIYFIIKYLFRVVSFYLVINIIIKIKENLLKNINDKLKGDKK